MNSKPINLANLLDRLGYTGDERFQLCSKGPGQSFTATVRTLAEAPAAERHVDRLADWWFGVNPVVEVDAGRPAAGDVTRLAGIWADLDVKPGGCPTMEVAQRIVDELESVLGEHTVAVTRSGHGLQPIWAVEDGAILFDEGFDQQRRSEARALLRRWGRLVAAVAERFGAQVDTVFDLPRILRVPNTVNHKAAPVPVVTMPGPGAPISVARILEVLDQFGIDDRPEDHDDPGAVVSAPAEWMWARSTCGYAELAMRGWSRDDPADRHPWLVAQATRIACMHRYGCLTAVDHARAVDRLITRFRVLLGRGGASREPGRGEISDALGWGQQRAAAMSDARLAEELGRHAHKERVNDNDRSYEIQGSGQTMEGRTEYLLSQRPEHSAIDHRDIRSPASLGAQLDVARRRNHPTLRELIAQAEASEAATAQQPAQTWAPAEPAEVDETPEQKQFRIDVADQAHRLWVADEARRLEQQRKAGRVEMPRPVNGAEFLAVADPPARYRLAREHADPSQRGLLPLGGKLLLSAQYKSGKSVMMGNLLRSLVDGDPFLDVFQVTPVEGRVVLVDDELDERTLRRWVREQGIIHADRFQVLSLRGRVASFDLTNETIRAEWARNLREAGCAFLIFDCLRPVLDAIGLSEDKESGAFLVALDALALDAGISEMAVVHHMGHASERSRGDSRLRDWPDAEWKIVRQAGAEDDPAAPRYFSAFGRDVDIKEGRLDLDGRRLTYKAGEKREKTSKSNKPDLPPITQAIEELLTEVDEPTSKRGLRRLMKTLGYPDPATREAIELLVGKGLVAVTEGPQRAHMLRWSE